MSGKQKNIEKRFLRELENMEIEPSSHVWRKVRARLFWREFMHFDAFRFNVYYVLGLIGAAIFVTILLTRGDENEESSASSLIPNQSAVISLPQHVVIKPDSITESLLLMDIPIVGLIDSLEVVPPVIKDSDPSETLQDETSGGFEAQVDKEVSSSDTVIEEALPSMQIMFSASVAEGCVPLKVWFSNFSDDADGYSWNFGDGGVSSEKDPVYVFDEPGAYTIALTAMNEGNEVGTYTLSILVHPLPEVRFEADLSDNQDFLQPIYFYNYTSGASDFFWDFGDGNTSDQKEPVHMYDIAGKYDIKLVAVTHAGCMDSAIVSDIMKEKGPELGFPSAFSPNMSGSIGGYYSGNERNHEVFYPYISEPPVEYLLRVFNRRGNLVFESNDINIGWDGYYSQELQPAGVYVWKVRTRFADGRTIVKAGDVTLLWRQPL